MPKVEESKKLSRNRINARARESQRQRLILIAGTLVIVSAVSLVGTGYYITQYRPLHQIVLKVNDKEFDMAYYVSAHKFYGTGQDVWELLEQNEMVRQAAEKLGITVTDEEARAEVEKRKLPTTAPNLTFIKAELLTNKMLNEYFDNQVSPSAPQRETMAMFLESAKQAQGIRDRLVAGEDFGKLAAQYSLDKTTKDASGYLDWHPQGNLAAMLNTSILDDYVFNATVGLLSDPVADATKSKSTGYWIAKVAARAEDQVHVMAILATDEDTAISARARINAGEDFAAIAKELSQLPGAKTDGGDLGFINKGDRGGVFDNFAFNAATKDGDISAIIRDDQVQTRGGYWLVKVLTADKDKIMSQQDHTALVNKTYYDWVSALWKDPNNKVESFLTPEMMQWAKDASKNS